MKIEEMGLGLGEKRRDNNNNSNKKRRICRRTRRRIQAENFAIQGLFEVSKAIFKGPESLPNETDVKTLQMFLDKMKPEDFGLRADLEFFKAASPSKGPPTITFSTIYSCENFSLCIFFLPPTAVIPLHNHPGMTVFNKLLLGTMHMKSYDWVDTATSVEAAPSNFRLARMVVDSEFSTPCKTSILYPTTGGNMHTFRAITPCALLDVLGPPYSKEDDRDCTYYKDHPYSHISDGSAIRAEEGDGCLGWLEEIEMPKDLKMVGVEYLGPQIIDR